MRYHVHDSKKANEKKIADKLHDFLKKKKILDKKEELEEYSIPSPDITFFFWDWEIASFDLSSLKKEIMKEFSLSKEQVQFVRELC